MNDYMIGSKVVNGVGVVGTIGGYTNDKCKVITEESKHEWWYPKDIVKMWQRKVPNIGDYVDITNPLKAKGVERTDGLYKKGEIHKVVGISPNDRRAVIQIGNEVHVLLDEEYEVIE